MSVLLGAGIVGGLFVVASYLERSLLKSELKKVYAKLSNIELAVKAKIKQEIETVLADAKAEAVKVDAKADAIVAKVEAKIKAIF